MNLLFVNDKRGAYPPSYYTATATPPEPFEPLRGEVKADVCVIGGGYTGLSAALHLAEQGVDVVLVEAHRVGFGASGRNGGQVGGGFNLDQPELERLVGEADARRLWDLSEEAKKLTRDLVSKHAPNAGYKSGIAHAEWQAGKVGAAHRHAEYLAEHYGYEQIDCLDGDAMRAIIGSPAYQGGTIDWGSGHLHPLRYAFGLARAAMAAGVRIFEMSHVHHLKRGSKPVVQTDRGRVIADHVILACNGYQRGLDRKVAVRVMPINNFIVATEPLDKLAGEVLTKDIAVDDSKFVVNYFRLSEDKRLIFGGGESYGYRYPNDIAAKVRKPMLQVFPQLQDVAINYAWGGTLAVTMNRMPYFARSEPNIYSASGYSGYGVAMAGLAGKAMAQAIVGDAARFDVFSRIPASRFPGGPPFSHGLLVLAMSWYAIRDRFGV
ncbi:MAG: FAD-binding oxidoreductase [Paracoccaceae bacterium]